jgi:Rrf2 family transcriptional regulator, iron-sulfur cluster assembly transcription factor
MLLSIFNSDGYILDKISRDSGPWVNGTFRSDFKGNLMRLTTKGRFAVTAMVDLALREQDGPVALAAISARQHISQSYLEQLFGKLRRHDLVQSTRGPGGGYSLGRAANEISIAEIILAVDEPIDATGCAGKENCMGQNAGRCMTHDLWASLNDKMMDYLNSVSLGHLVDGQLAKGPSVVAQPVRRGISSEPVVKPLKITTPNSVFALGHSATK